MTVFFVKHTNHISLCKCCVIGIRCFGIRGNSCRTKQWRILIRSSGKAEGYTMRHCTVPIDLTSGRGFATATYFVYLNLCPITRRAPSTLVYSHLQFWVWGVWELENITTPVRKVTFTLVPSQPWTTKGLAAPRNAPLPSLYITLCETK